MIALLAALLLALTPPAPAPAVLLLVESPGEAFTPAQAREAGRAARDALAWWSALAPAPVAFAITEERTVRAEAPLDSLEWLDPHLAGDGLTIIVVANYAGRGLFAGRLAGFATADPPVAGAVALSSHGLAPTLAHELGHALYGLPDDPGGCVGRDIMCAPARPYGDRFIGCASLALLGAPCQRVGLPIVQRRG